MLDKEKKEYVCPKCGVKLTLGNTYNYNKGYCCIDCALKKRVKIINQPEKKTIQCKVCSKELIFGDIALYPTTIICKECDEHFRRTNYYIAHLKDKASWNMNVVQMPKEVSFKNYAATLSLLIVIFVVYLISSIPDIQRVNPFFVQWGALIPQLLFDGQLWRLITPNFLHADLNHIFANSVSIAIWGHLLERYVGSRAVFALIFLSCLLTTTFSAFMSPETLSLGASGIAYGLMTAFVLYAITLTVLNKPAAFRGQMVSFMVLVLVQIAYNYYESANVDVWGHLGGAVAGVIFILLYALVNVFTLIKKQIK